MQVNQRENRGSVVGSMAGIAGGTMVSTAGTPVALGIAYGLKKIGSVPQDTVELLQKGAKDALKNTGLAEKGVGINYVTQSKGKLNIKELLTNPHAQISAGINAGFAPNINEIYMPAKDMQFAVFHEIGHAHNYNFSKIGRFLQKTRMPGMALAGAILMYGACSKESKAKDGEKLTFLQKTNNFIRNNAGKLSFGALVPMLAEEAMASIKGQKMANSVLSKDLAKHVLKGNIAAYSSYLAVAVAAGLGAMAAVKIKDHFVAKKAAKAAQAQMQPQAQKA